MSLSVFAKLPVPAVELDNPLHYADSAVSVTKLRKTAVSGELKSILHRHLLDIKLHPRYIDHLNVYDIVAKVFNLGVSSYSTLDHNRWWVLASVLVLFLFEFDDHFDQPPHLTPKSIAWLTKEMMAVLTSLSRHNLSGLQGSLEDWPVEVPGKEAYLWLLREAEDLRKGAAELIHDTFVDYCYGVKVEVTEWQSDMCRGDLTAWNLDRYKEVRKRSSGFVFLVVGPLFIMHRCVQKEHIITCTDLLYEASTVVALANDVLGMNRDRGNSGAIDITSLKIVQSSSEIVRDHNEMVEVLHKKALELECNTRHYMEQVEAGVVGLFLWQCHSKRYTL